MDISLIATIASLGLAIASIVLAVVAIWLALYQKSETDRVNKATQDLLTEIRSDSKAITQYAIPELRAYGEAIRNRFFNDQVSRVSDNVPQNPENAKPELKERLLSELKYLKQNAGKALSLQLFERLEHEYDFAVLLAELYKLQKTGILTWEGAPNPPDALAEIRDLSPYPGTAEANARGCTCTVTTGANGKPLYAITKGCPIPNHG